MFPTPGPAFEPGTSRFHNPHRELSQDDQMRGPSCQLHTEGASSETVWFCWVLESDPGTRNSPGGKVGPVRNLRTSGLRTPAHTSRIEQPCIHPECRNGSRVKH